MKRKGSTPAAFVVFICLWIECVICTDFSLVGFPFVRSFFSCVFSVDDGSNIVSPMHLFCLFVLVDWCFQYESFGILLNCNSIECIIVYALQLAAQQIQPSSLVLVFIFKQNE